MQQTKQQKLISEACAWIARLETGDLSKQDRLVFSEWMDRSPAHVEAITKMAQLSSDINIIAGMDVSLEKATKSTAPFAKQNHRKSIFNIPNLALASFVILISFTIVFDMNTMPDHSKLIMTTSVGEYKENLLSDGSLIKLNTNSQIKVDYTDQQRNIYLLKGEAFFDVSHDVKRPFIVYAQNKIVRAVGTAFGVRVKDTELEVVVSEGRVELKDFIDLAKVKSVPLSLANDNVNKASINTMPAKKVSPVYLDAGQRTIVSPERKKININMVSKREIVRELSWQEGLLDFSSTPLPEVVSEVSRYTSLKIEIADPELHELTFGGIIRTGEVDTLFEALTYSFNIKVEYVNNNFVRLHYTKS